MIIWNLNLHSKVEFWFEVEYIKGSSYPELHQLTESDRVLKMSAHTIIL